MILRWNVECAHGGFFSQVIDAKGRMERKCFSRVCCTYVQSVWLILRLHFFHVEAHRGVAFLGLGMSRLLFQSHIVLRWLKIENFHPLSRKKVSKFSRSWKVLALFSFLHHLKICAFSSISPGTSMKATSKPLPPPLPYIFVGKEVHPKE